MKRVQLKQIFSSLIGLTLIFSSSLSFASIQDPNEKRSCWELSPCIQVKHAIEIENSKKEGTCEAVTGVKLNWVWHDSSGKRIEQTYYEWEAPIVEAKNCQETRSVATVHRNEWNGSYLDAMIEACETEVQRSEERPELFTVADPCNPKVRRFVER